MSITAKRRFAGILIALITVVSLAVVNWLSAPRLAQAQSAPGSSPLKTSIVFVIDSSKNMFPHDGPSYFDMAKDGIAELLDRPGFDAWGRYEISVIQYADLEAHGYEEGHVGNTAGVHWFAPIRVTEPEVLDDVQDLVAGLGPSKHFTASMMELGIREATCLLDPDCERADTVTTADETVARHIILLGTGEYRLPPPCPPDGYTGLGVNSVGTGVSCDHDDEKPDCINSYGTTVMCNRACHIRSFAKAALQNKILTGEGISISTVRLGLDWHNDIVPCLEDLTPYASTVGGDDEDLCPATLSSLPWQPDRGGFMIELAECGYGQTPPPIGNNARITPNQCFDATLQDCIPGTAEDVADAITGWLCTWTGHEDDSEQDGGGNPDPDGIMNLCDNCPDVYNPHQRDCDGDGQGDLCQWPSLSDECDVDSDDSDCDGVHNDDDVCEGGDDCLVLKWSSQSLCEDAGDPLTCNCDCNHNCEYDACEAAVDLSGDTLPFDGATISTWWLNHDDDDYDGIADHCNSPATCARPYPELCDPERMDDNTYAETFSAFAEGNAFDDGVDDGPLEEAGWLLSDPEAADAAEIFVVPVSTPVHFLKVGVTNSLATDGTAPWVIEGPGQLLPPFLCGPSVCLTPAVADWGAYRVDLEMLVASGGDGPTYDLRIMDPYEEDWSAATRVWLRLTPDGRILSRSWGECEGEDEDGMILVGTFTSGTEFTLSVFFNQALNLTPESCTWWPRPSVKLVAQGGANISCGSTFDELGTMEPGRPRGVQIQVETDNYGGLTWDDEFLYVKSILLTKASQCEFNTGGTACSGGTCFCSWSEGFNHWWCAPIDPDCANDVLDPGEECRPPNGITCDRNCRWRCGDSYLQGPYYISGPRWNHSVPYSQELCENMGVEECRAGSEECEVGDRDRPLPDGAWGCHSCRLMWRCNAFGSVCGDGYVCDLDGEECDDGNTIDGDGCSSNCQFESGGGSG